MIRLLGWCCGWAGLSEQILGCGDRGGFLSLADKNQAGNLFEMFGKARCLILPILFLKCSRLVMTVTGQSLTSISLARSNT